MKTFVNVASLKLAHISTGQLVRTQGYYSAGDGGEGTYLIVAPRAFDGYGDHELANSNIAVLQHAGTVDTKQFGVKLDGVTDDTDANQACLDAGSGVFKIVVSPGVGASMVEAVTKNINIPSNTHLTFLPGAEWKAITNASDSYIVVDIRDATNVFIYNPVITGDKPDHTGSTGEQGHCLNISSTGTTDNVHIYSPVCTKAWGDGIVIRNGTNLHFYDAYCDDNRRNGITINKGSTVHFHGTTTAINTDGTAPEAGLDIEPNDATGELKDIVFDKLMTAGNTGPGCTFNIGDFANGGVDKEVTVTVHEHHDNGSIYGLNVEKCAEGATETITGTVRFCSQTYINNGSNGVYYNDYAANNTPHIFMDSLSVINPNALDSTSTTFGVGINFDRKVGSGLTTDIGNCTITRPTIVDNRAVNQMTRGITAFDNDASGADLANLKIVDPIEISGYDADGDAVHVGYNGMELSDRFGQVERILAGSLSVTSRTYSKLSTSNASLFTVTDGITKDNSGLPLELFSNGAGGIRFDPSALRSVFPLSLVAGKYIESTDVGARIKMKYNATDDTWYVLEQIGTWSVEP